MNAVHILSLGTHIGAGGLALLLGLWLLWRPKGSAWHRRNGLRFVLLALGVCGSAVAGVLLFRPEPFLAMLSLTVLYQLVSGWRCARTQAQGPVPWDAAWTALGLIGALLLGLSLHRQGLAHASVVVRSTFVSMYLVMFYDAARWCFPAHWHARLWLAEHACKLIAVLSGLLSALAGNVLNAWHPWSQLLPSVMGLVAMVWLLASRRGRPGRLDATLMPVVPNSTQR